jgi:hypothetical protein
MRIIFFLRNSLTFKILFAFLFILSSQGPIKGDFKSGQLYRNFKERLDRLPFTFSTVVEFETSTSAFYGRLKKNGLDFFASIDADTGEIKHLNKLTSIAN